MTSTRILPDIGTPVSLPGFDEQVTDGMSVGQLAYAATLFTTALVGRMANPATAHGFAPFVVDHGADWSG